MRHAPLLLAQPTRFATLSRPVARAILAVIAVALVGVLLSLAAGDPGATGEAQAILSANTGIVDAVSHGEPYYTAAAQAQPAGSEASRAFGTLPLPTLAVIQAALPDPVMVVLQWALAAACLFAWWHRLAPSLVRPWARIAALLLLAAGAARGWQYNAAPLHELWAGLLIALSLALRTRDRWVEAMALALAAALIADAAGLYLIVMAALALIGGHRREALGWAGAVAAFAVAAMAHAHAAGQVARAIETALPAWGGTLGLGLATQSWSSAAGLDVLPLVLAAPALILSIIGWVAWRGDTGLRVAATIIAYLLLLAIVAGARDMNWGLLIAPVALAGLVFAPDALRDLFAAALDRRRITVRRVVR